MILAPNDIIINQRSEVKHTVKKAVKLFNRQSHKFRIYCQNRLVAPYLTHRAWASPRLVLNSGQLALNRP